MTPRYAIYVINRTNGGTTSPLLFQTKADALQHFAANKRPYAGSNRELCVYDCAGGYFDPIASSHGLDKHQPIRFMES